MTFGKLVILSCVFAAALAGPVENCDYTHKPICAQREGTTVRFLNECWLEKENSRSYSKFKILTDAEPCAKFENTGCAFKCSSVPTELCAHNGEEQREFVNSCQLKGSNCKSPKIWAVTHFGKC